jgi:hypothetical protein
MALAPSHRIASHESHVQIYGVVSTAPPEFPPPKLKKARVGATVLVRRLVETVGRVVTLVPVANADIVIAIMMDGTARSVRPSVTAAIGSKKPLLLSHPENEANGKGSRTSCKVGRQREGEKKKAAFCIYRIDGSQLKPSAVKKCTTFLRFLFLFLLLKKEESLVLVES